MAKNDYTTIAIGAAATDQIDELIEYYRSHLPGGPMGTLSRASFVTWLVSQHALQVLRPEHPACEGPSEKR